MLSRIALVIVFAVISVTLSVLGPKVLGEATNIIFDGVIGSQIPAGVTVQQAIDGLNASGQTQLADMLASMTVTPGAGVDFGALASVLALLAALYLFSSLFSWAQAYIMAGVTQRTVYRLRRDVDEWRIVQYNLTIPVPDELAPELVAKIRGMRPA